jgi:hypothetical protein
MDEKYEPSSDEMLEMWKEVKAPIDKAKERYRRYRIKNREKYLAAQKAYKKSYNKTINKKLSDQKCARKIQENPADREARNKRIIKNIINRRKKFSTISSDSMSKWTDGDVLMLRKLTASGHTMPQIAVILKRSLRSIECKRYKLKIHSPKRRQQ